MRLYRPAVRLQHPNWTAIAIVNRPWTVHNLLVAGLPGAERAAIFAGVMGERPRDRAICLRAVDFSETSQVLHLLTREAGVVHLLAKGSKRPKSKTGGRIDLLAEGEVVYIPSRGEGLGTLVEFSERSGHAALRRRLADLNAALYMAETTAMLLAEGDPHANVFDLLSAALHRLDRGEAPTRAVLAYFQWRAMRYVGLLGTMDRCVACGGPLGAAGVYFSSREGGPLCRNCESARTEKIPLPRPALAGIAALAAMDRREQAALDETAAAAVIDLLAYHLTYLLGRSPRMLRYVRPDTRPPTPGPRPPR